jgi:II/X family phage/plasmid replication protein
MVEWSGNPSRWGRKDNVFGYTSLRDCLDKVINPHMRYYCLPEFTFDVDSTLNSRRFSRERESASLVDTGAVLTRVDICRNVSAGSPVAMRAYLRAASSAVYRNKGPSTSHDGSIAWGNQRHSRIKFYDKSAELLAHTKKGTCEVSADLREYRESLAKWCYDLGVIRQEITFGRQYLRAAGLRALSEWSDNRAFALFIERVDSMTVGCSSSLTDTLDKFIDAGFSVRQAANLSGFVSRWYMGESVTAGCSRATFHRYKSSIKKVLGVDVSSSPDIAVLTARVQNIVLSPVAPPSWYLAA